jgi:polar amino acid transport system substrate-binding protein
MKTRLTALGAVALCGCIAFTVTSVAGRSAAPACTRLVLTGHPSYPPVSWKSGDTLEGGGIEVVRRLAKDRGVELQIVHEGTWDDAQQAVKTGKADAIVGLYKTQARLPFFNYVDPAIAPDPSAVIVRAGEAFPYEGWNSLIGKTGVANVGEAYGHAFDSFAASKLKIERVHGFHAVYQAVIDHQADYGLAGYYPAETEMPKDKLTFATPNFATEGLYLAFGKNTPCASLAPAFSKDIAALIADGTVKKLLGAALSSYESSHR